LYINLLYNIFFLLNDNVTYVLLVDNHHYSPFDRFLYFELSYIGERPTIDNTVNYGINFYILAQVIKCFLSATHQNRIKILIQ
jgi:hypothetical protein